MNMTQRGNILFLILLAVVLFAALAYAVTSSMRGGGKDAKTETITAQVAAINSFFSQLDGAVMRMQMSGGQRTETLSFVYDKKMFDGSTGANAYNNPNCTTDSCRVFKPDGGNVAVQTFENYAYSAPFNWSTGNTMPGFYDFIVLQWPSAGTIANDIVLQLNAMPGPLCKEINNQQGITATPTASGAFLSAYPVSNWDGAGWTIATNAEQLIGKTTYATTIQGTGDPARCHIYHLLITR